MFILNLAIADLIVCIFSLPITPITNIYKNWYFGDHMCHSLPWIQGASVFIATFSLSSIAVDRYFMIVKPHRQRISKNSAKVIMLTLWLSSVLITLPYSWFMALVEYDGLCGKFCTESWPSDPLRRSYTVFVLIAQFFVPFTIMFFCYYKIFDQLTQRTREKIKKLNERSLVLAASMPIMSAMKKRLPPQDDILTQCRRKCELIQQARRNTVVLVSMVVVFGVAWLPQNIVSVALEFTDGSVFISSEKDYSYLISLTAHW
uniref:G_PROTEIN_RECEP_F1_2 domain-containing protein n=1 Tax=Heterorhabditis bacteriophora TaxID=37862 RepID=A0A1I7XGQ9_HETBA